MSWPTPEHQTHVCPWHRNTPVEYVESYEDDRLGLVHIYRCPIDGCMQMHDIQEDIDCFCDK